MFPQWTTRFLVCVLLSGFGLAIVWCVRSTARLSEPFVDFSHRASPANRTIASSTEDSNRLRFGVATMVSAEATFSTYRLLVERICRDVGRQEAFIVRSSYADIRKELEKGRIDVALVCTGTYVHSLGRARIKLLAQPEFEGALQYRGLIIVPAESNYESLDDLRGTVMAFTDPESNTGCFVPREALASHNLDPESFFKKIVFTGSHDRSILAVALSAVDVAAVDALIWESKLQEDPSLADRVRVLWQSEPFGPPPIVVPASIEPDLENALREAFLALDKDENGREILSAIGIRRFVLPRPASYETAAALYRRVHQRESTTWP